MSSRKASWAGRTSQRVRRAISTGAEADLNRRHRHPLGSSTNGKRPGSDDRRKNFRIVPGACDDRLMAQLRSVNVGTPREAEWAGIGRTSIDKRPVTGPVRAHPLGLEGDQVADTEHHGGVDQAVYAFAREDLDFWEGELGQPIRDGQFGENLTTEGIDVNEALVGERWQIGTAVL